MSFFSPSFIRNEVQRTLHLWKGHFDTIFRTLATISVLHKTFFTILLASAKIYYDTSIENNFNTRIFLGRGKIEKVENQKA